MLADLIVTSAIGLVDKIPTGKGKRKMAARFLDAEAKNVAQLRGQLEAAANRGEVLSGFALQMLSNQLGITQKTMETTVAAIGPDDIANDDAES